MSIIAHFARLSRDQLDSLLQSSGGLQGLYGERPPGAELIDLDKAAPVISWLLSPCKRAEQLHFAALMAEDLGESVPDPTALPAIPPLDPLAIAIEGRGPTKESRLKSPYGPACLFSPKEVEAAAALLSPVDEGTLRKELDFQLMDTLFLPVEYWQEEGERTFSQYILPLFERLKAFYQAAARAGQWVVFWNG